MWALTSPTTDTGVAVLAAVSRFYCPRQGERCLKGIDSINLFAKVLVRLGPTPLLTELWLLCVTLLRMFSSNSEVGGGDRLKGPVKVKFL